MSMAEVTGYYNGPHGRLAFRRRAGKGPGIVWFGGYASDMTGTKATFLDEVAQRTGRAFLRFDYSGHGLSDGAFEDGTIGSWAADAAAIFDAMAIGPQIIVGSSMGAWIATLVAASRPDRIAGAVFIAPAPDFTEDLLWAGLNDADRARLLADGRLTIGEGGPASIFTRALVEDGRRNLVLQGPIPLTCPVRILQGMADPDVPYRHALKFAEAIRSFDVIVELVKFGDHRLSTPADLDRLERLLRSVE
jgi:pimeloyl-ACP methyl ester carboxylesterase